MSTTEKLGTLLGNYVTSIKGILAAAVVDQDGLIISSKMNENITQEDAVGAITAALGMAAERLKNEFKIIGHFGAQIQTEQGVFIFTNAGKNQTLTTLTTEDGEPDEIIPYAYMAAEKLAQLLDLRKEVVLTLPSLDDFEEQKFTYKIMVLGDGGVGKTSLINQFIEKTFMVDYKSTIGVNIMTKNYTVMENLTIKFSIFDIAGQKYFRKVRKQYYRGSQAIIYVYDVTNRETLEGVKKWKEDVEETLKGQELKSLLIGNKIDLVNQRQVDMMEGKEFAEQMGLPYIETSAKDGTNVDKAFGRIATKLAVDSMIK
ncbi:MAG: GTP-binding protein [Candidatus Lokiarchaeota archaeon]|nr:GTP-binding protein [Candidatus Lokiarchaeota archaeon]